MAHFAEINKDNIVKRVIVVHNNEITIDNQELEFKGIDFCEGLYGHRNWVQTSYNGTIRHNFAGEGYTWDEANDAFYAPKPFASWSLDDNFKWQPPVAYPSDDKVYSWDEENQEWKVVELTV